MEGEDEGKGEEGKRLGENVRKSERRRGLFFFR